MIEFFHLTTDIRLFAFAFFLQALAAEFAYRIGRRTHRLADGDSKSYVGTMQAAVLGLLALLLGFTFSMAASRYDARKLLLVEEVNAIGTANLRADLLPDPNNVNAKALFRKYLDARVDFFTAGSDNVKIKRACDATEATQRALWAEAMDASHKNPRTVAINLFIQSLNDVIDMHTKQVAAFNNRIPASILQLLLLVSIISAGLTGYAASATPGRNWIPTYMMILLVTSVSVLIVDLHHPRRGVIQVEPELMIQLRDALNQ